MLGMDFDAQRLALARQLGAEAVDLSGGAGAGGAMNPRLQGRRGSWDVVCGSTNEKRITNNEPRTTRS